MTPSQALQLVRRRVARPLLHELRRPEILRETSRPSEARFLGYRLRARPGVFHPVHFSSSAILAERVLDGSVRGRRVLDMGTGAGPIAIVAAATGAEVVACDVNPSAVALARENAARNGVRVEVLESDLFAAIPGRTFDLIAFNIPFYPSDPTTAYEAAFKAGERLATVRRFAAEAPLHLAADGRVVIVFSEDCDRRAIHEAFTAAGLRLTDERTTRRWLEDFIVASFRR